jgi:hypothetical protein
VLCAEKPDLQRRRVQDPRVKRGRHRGRGGGDARARGERQRAEGGMCGVERMRYTCAVQIRLAVAT